MPDFVAPLMITLATVAAMEVAAAGVHKYVMHGFGWSWHRSHHVPGEGRLERNDLYALFFAAIALPLFVFGHGRLWPLYWIGVGMAVYGLLYVVVHDGLVHRRLPIGRTPRTGYLKRLVQAHRMHHAVKEREGAVSFGFLYAPPLDRLRSALRDR